MYFSDRSYFTISCLFDLLSVRHGTVTGDRRGGGWREGGRKSEDDRERERKSGKGIKRDRWESKLDMMRSGGRWVYVRFMFLL